MSNLDSSIQNELNQRYRATATVVFAQLFTAVALVVAAYFVAGSFHPFGATSDEASLSLDALTNPAGRNVVPSALWITILAIAIAVFLLRRVLFNPNALRDTATIGGAGALLKSLQTKTIVLAALGEIVAILGFVISLMSGNYFDMLRAAAVTLILFFINLPLKSVWQRLVAAAK